MQIELRKVKVCNWMSEETTCYQAEIWIDGKKMGDASNEGHGGPDMIHPYSLHQMLDDHATKTIPTRKTKWGDIKPDAEILIGKLLSDWEARKKFASDMKNKLIYTSSKTDSKVYESKFKKKLTNGATKIFTLQEVEAILRKAGHLTDGVILNLLPIEDAFAIYKKAVFPEKPEVELV